MISKIIAGILIVLAAGGFIAYQRAEIKRLSLAVAVEKGNTKALTEVRKDDQRNVNTLTAEIARQRAARDKLAKQLEANADETRAFFAMPIPGGVRNAINEYLTKYKAPDNRK